MKKMRDIAFAISAFFLGLAQPAIANDSYLFANQLLFPGQSIVAPGCYYHLEMRQDGNLVLYAQNTALWASGTVGPGRYAAMQSDGNFVVYNINGTAYWSTGTHRYPGSYLALQDDGNLVVYEGSSARWASHTSGEKLATRPCHYSSSITTFEVGVDRPGNDYTSYTMSRPSPHNCAYWCVNESRCRAYTYVPPGEGSQARCWLKDRVPNTVSQPGMVSGIVR